VARRAVTGIADRQQIAGVHRPDRAASGPKRDGRGVLDVNRLAAGCGQLGLDARDLLASDETQCVQPVAAQPGQDAAASGFTAEQPGARVAHPDLSGDHAQLNRGQPADRPSAEQLAHLPNRR